MKPRVASIYITILILVIINIVIYIQKFSNRSNQKDDVKTKNAMISVYCEDVPENIVNLIEPGDTQTLGKRALAKIMSIKNIQKNPYRKDDLITTYNFILELSISRILLEYTTLKLFSPIAFETGDFRIDGKLFQIEGGI